MAAARLTMQVVPGVGRSDSTLSSFMHAVPPPLWCKSSLYLSWLQPSSSSLHPILRDEKPVVAY